MKRLLALVLLAPWMAQADPATNAPAMAPAGTPRVLALELTILRYKPATNEAVFHDFKLTGTTPSIVDTLRASGSSVDVLYHGTRELVLEPKSSAKFNATETRPVILIGKQGTSPPALVYGLTMEVIARPLSGDSFILNWDGTLNWSPDLIDRRATGPNASQVLEKAANAAKSITALTGKSAAADIGLAVADLFKEDTVNNSAIYELPVLKTVALSGSHLCHGGETIVNTTAAEAGAKEPQIIFFLINPTLP
ncbi:MAG TPA: hypothetical protein VHB20_03835 [Verrucomicrobiae bacterium]|jgi:hypothetical protein|nr:hypothetical protein [Verrucomicrobiae bacterium]